MNEKNENVVGLIDRCSFKNDRDKIDTSKPLVTFLIWARVCVAKGETHIYPLLRQEWSAT